MTVELTREQEQLIERQLKSGRFSDKAEVIAKALALLERHGAAVADVQADIREGLDDLFSGRSRDYSQDSVRELAEDIKQRGRVLKAKRESSTLSATSDGQ